MKAEPKLPQSDTPEDRRERWARALAPAVGGPSGPAAAEKVADRGVDLRGYKTPSRYLKADNNNFEGAGPAEQAPADEELKRRTISPSPDRRPPTSAPGGRSDAQNQTHLTALFDQVRAAVSDRATRALAVEFACAVLRDWGGLPPRLTKAQEAAIRHQAKKYPWSRRRDRFQKPPKFIKEVYGKWLGKGITQAHLTIDAALYNQLSKWLVENELPSDFGLPTMKEVTEQTARFYEAIAGDRYIEAGSRMASRQNKAKGIKPAA